MKKNQKINNIKNETFIKQPLIHKKKLFLIEIIINIAHI